MEDIKRTALRRLLNSKQNASLPYQTSLTPTEELGFNNWQQENQVPYNPGAKSDYDMKGFFKAMQSNDPSAKSEVSPVDNQLHFTDKFKTPYHKSFSNESQYATEDAPEWDGNKLVKKKQTIFVELPNGK